MKSTEGNKYRNWVFTINSDNEGQLINYESLQTIISEFSDDWIFQLEMGEETQRIHFQGCLKTKIRVRHSTLLNYFREGLLNQKCGGKMLEFLTIDRMQGDFEQAKEYCTKKETRLAGPYASVSLQIYEGNDIMLFALTKHYYPWQLEITKMIISKNGFYAKPADDRTIVWITDKEGNSGKSKFVKYVCWRMNSAIKLPFGTASQLRSAVISAGPRKIYFIDIPRTLGDDDSLNSIISVIEDIKNGFIISAMYGKYDSLMFDPPHVVIFSNIKCPRIKMSADRWKVYEIIDKHLIDIDKYENI